MSQERKNQSHPGRSVPQFSEEKLSQVLTSEVRESAEDLINSDLMLKRVRDGNEISCCFVTYDGHVNCAVNARKYTLQELCTCEATYFCRHAAALVMTYLQFPETFLDLEQYLDDLDKQPKDELVGMLRQLVGRYPGSSLEALGRSGFQLSKVLEELDGEFALDDELLEDSDLFERLHHLNGLAEDTGLDETDELEDFDDDPGSRGNLN